MNALSIHKYNGTGQTIRDTSVKGYQDVIWLAGKVFVDRNFVDQIEANGIDAVLSECPYGDLSDEQKDTFGNTFSRWEMKLLVRIWWIVYDYLRARNKIVGISEAWRP